MLRKLSYCNNVPGRDSGHLSIEVFSEIISPISPLTYFGQAPPLCREHREGFDKSSFAIGPFTENLSKLQERTFVWLPTVQFTLFH